jgi:hypothetical protein
VDEFESSKWREHLSIDTRHEVETLNASATFRGSRPAAELRLNKAQVNLLTALAAWSLTLSAPAGRVKCRSARRSVVSQ